MWRVAAILAAIAAFVYVAVVGVQWLRPRVEDDILNRVNSALAEQGLLWADVSVDGRKVILGGTAPSDESRTRAAMVAARVFGVAGVSDAIVVGDASGTAPVHGNARGNARPYQLTIVKTVDTLVVRGQVATSQDADVIRRILRNHYEGMKVEDALEVAEHAPAGWRSAVGVVLVNLTNLEDAQVTLSGTEVMLQGAVLDQKYSDGLQAAVSAAMPQGYKVAYAVDVVTPSMVAEVVSASAPVGASATAVASETAGVMASVADRLEAVVAGIEPAAGAAAQPVADCSGMAALEKHVVRFDFDKAALKAEYRPVMRQIAGTLKGCPDQHLTVAGYTDKTGSPMYNQWLSEQRAESGVRALRREGVAGSQLTAIGLGEVNPVAPNTTREGRAQNRRIEFKPGMMTASSTVPAGTEKAVVPASETVSGTAQGGWWTALMRFTASETDVSGTSVSDSVPPASVSATAQ